MASWILMLVWSPSVVFWMVKSGHAAKKLFQGLLTGDKISKRIVDQHIVAFVISEITIWLKDIGICADDHIYALLHQEIGPFFLILGRHGLFSLAPVGRKDHTVCCCTSCLIAAATLVVSKVSTIEPEAGVPVEPDWLSELSCPSEEPSSEPSWVSVEPSEEPD